MNKKGQMFAVVIILLALFLVMFLGLLFAFGSMTMNWVFDEAVPELTGLGQVGSTNMTEVTDITIVPLNTFVQSLTFMAGVCYVLILLGMFGLAFAFRMTGGKWLIGLFVVGMFMVILTAMFVSNIYEDFYDDGSEVGERLHEHIILSWFLLYSPLVIAIVGFVCGIIMFTGTPEEGFV